MERRGRSVVQCLPALLSGNSSPRCFRYVIILAKIKPSLMPPLSQEERRVALPSFAQRLSHTGDRAVTALVRGLKGPRNADVPARTLVFQLGITLLPALVIVLFMGLIFRSVTAPPTVQTRVVCRRWVLSESRGSTDQANRPLNRLRLRGVQSPGGR